MKALKVLLECKVYLAIIMGLTVIYLGFTPTNGYGLGIKPSIDIDHVFILIYLIVLAHFMYAKLEGYYSGLLMISLSSILLIFKVIEMI